MAGYSVKIDASVFGADRVKALNPELALIGKQAQQLPAQFTNPGVVSRPPLRSNTSSTRRAARSLNGQFLTSTQKAAAGIRDVGTAAEVAAERVQRPQLPTASVVRRSGHQTLAALCPSPGAKFVLSSTAELETQTRSLKVLTGSLEDAKQIISDLQVPAVTPHQHAADRHRQKPRAFGVDTEDLMKPLAVGCGRCNRCDLVASQPPSARSWRRAAYRARSCSSSKSGSISYSRKCGADGRSVPKGPGEGPHLGRGGELALKNVTEAGGKYADGAIAQSDTLAGKFSTLQDGVTRSPRQSANRCLLQSTRC